ncbi:MAG: energy transducer TonB [Bacteroidia bacterium]|nr:energy transducer TonB [Bacteroidia bacterium]
MKSSLKFFALLLSILFIPQMQAQNIALSTDSPEVKVVETANDSDEAWYPIPLNFKEIAQKVPYPKVAMEAGIEADIKISVMVDEQGRYHSHKVLGKASPMFMKEIEPYLSQLRFKAAMRNGKAVKAKISLPFRFRLRH